MDDAKKLTPIKPARLAAEIKQLSEGLKNGKYAPDEYEHRFARMVGELRDRSIDGNRAEIMAALNPLKLDGTLDPVAWDRLTKSLGLA
jgi:hypothetical protein